MNNNIRNKNNEINLRNDKKTKSKSFDKFSLSLWFLKNRRKLFIGTVLFLFILSVVLFLFSFYNIYDYIRGIDKENKDLEELTNIGVTLNPSRTAIELEYNGIQYFSHDGKYDFLAKVKNPNPNFFSNIVYCFYDGEVELACGGSLIYPNENKYVMILSVSLKNRPDNLSFSIKNTSWERVDVKKYPDWNAYYSERNNFMIADSVFKADKIDGSSGYVNNVSFSIKNNTPYNYWEVPLSIILFKNNNVVGINKYTISEFMSFDQKKVNLSWINSIKSVSDILVIPDFDITDEDNYIKYK